MYAVPVLQAASAALLNACFAWLIGSILARRWLAAAGASEATVEASLRQYDILVAAIGALAGVAALWAATAVMGGVDLLEAKAMFWMMVTTTDHGHAGCISIAALLAVCLLRAFPALRPIRETLVLGALAIFAVTRASMGHAGEDGWWSTAMASESTHLFAMGVWAGVVFVSAWAAVGSARLTLSLSETSRYLEFMSKAAMAAVIVILGTGLFNAWQRIGTPANLLHGLYAGAFLFKMALVGTAVLLGGYNKFSGMRQASESSQGVQRVKFVLQLESVLMLGVLVAAAIMTSQQPPAAM
jgi:putative copper resistance protein D